MAAVNERFLVSSQLFCLVVLLRHRQTKKLRKRKHRFWIRDLLKKGQKYLENIVLTELYLSTVLLKRQRSILLQLQPKRFSSIVGLYNLNKFIVDCLLPTMVGIYADYSDAANKMFPYRKTVADCYDYMETRLKQTLRQRQGWLTTNNRILHAQQRTFLILWPWRILHAVVVQSTTLLMALFTFSDDVNV